MIHVRYEDLVNPSKNELERILDFLQVPTDLRKEYVKAKMKQQILPRQTGQKNAITSKNATSTLLEEAHKRFYSTKRESGFKSDNWRAQLPKDVLKSIETNPICAKLFDKMTLLRK